MAKAKVEISAYSEGG